jgi:hypothetical protein
VGPRLIAVRQYFSEAHNISILPAVRIHPLDALSEDQLMANAWDPAETRLLIDLENERRRLVRKIREAIEKPILTGGLPSQIPDAASTLPASPTGPDDPRPPDKIAKSKCLRYDQIRKFLCRRRIRRDLALETMNFVMPEHTLLGYIIAHGGLQPELQPEEWRNFLVVAHHTKELFS